MISLKCKNTNLLADGQYLSNGDWIVDLDKIPLGGLLKEKMDIVRQDDKPQLQLFPEEKRDFSKIIPRSFDHSLHLTPLKYRSWTCLISKDANIVAWLESSYLKLFSDIDYETIYCNGNNQMVCFVDVEGDFLFGIMPITFQDNFEYFEFLSRHYASIKLENAKEEISMFPNFYVIADNEEDTPITITAGDEEVKTTIKTIQKAAAALK